MGLGLLGDPAEAQAPTGDLFLGFVILDKYGAELMNQRHMVTVNDTEAYMKAMLELHVELHAKEKI